MTLEGNQRCVASRSLRCAAQAGGDGCLRPTAPPACRRTAATAASAAHAAMGCSFGASNRIGRIGRYLRCSAAQRSAPQRSAVQRSAVQRSALKCSAVQCSAVQCSADRPKGGRAAALRCTSEASRCCLPTCNRATSGALTGRARPAEPHLPPYAANMTSRRQPARIERSTAALLSADSVPPKLRHCGRRA